MKKFHLLILTLTICLSGHSQILRSIANGAVNQAKSTATNKASDKVNREVDKGVSKFLDNLLKEDSTKTQTDTVVKSSGDAPQTEASFNRFMKRVGVSSESVPHKDNYKFTGQVVMSNVITDEDGKEVSDTKFKTCFNEDNSDVMFTSSTSDDGTATIVDKENMVMMVLTESNGSKTGFATKFDPNVKSNFQQLPEAKGDETSQSTTDENECVPTKTGNTKTISGFKCSEYRCENNEAVVQVWVTKEFDASKNSLFGNSGMGINYKTEGFDGMIICYETHSKVDKSSSIMTFESIDMKKSSSFSTVGYQISSFSINSTKK